MASFDALTADEQLKKLGEAIEVERRAVNKQREAISLRSQALDARAQEFAQLKTAVGGPAEG